jgi:hypothetical protein
VLRPLTAVDMITIGLYLQRAHSTNKNGLMLFIGGKKNFNLAYVYKGIDVNVPGGYYYRTQLTQDFGFMNKKTTFFHTFQCKRRKVVLIFFYIDLAILIISSFVI